MIVTKLPPGALVLADSQGRPSGLHLSTVIKSLMMVVKPKVYGKPMDLNKVNTGLAFEEVLERSFYSAKSGTFRPDPILVPVEGTPGIWCSPDGIDPTLWSVEEFKLTWYSASKECPLDEVYWPWLVQIKGYCYALETLLARLWVLHINGDYKPPRPWPPQVYGLEFHKLEIIENWQMVVNHAKAEKLWDKEVAVV